MLCILVPQQYYSTFFWWIGFFLCLGYALKIKDWSNSELFKNQNNFLPTLIFTILIIIYFGLRPLHGAYLGDTSNYVQAFDGLKGNPYAVAEILNSDSEDRLFGILIAWMAQWTSPTTFFTFVATIYLGCTLWASVKLFPNNPWVALLTVLFSFSFYSYGINGIRNGMACAIVCVAIAYGIQKGWRPKILALLLCFIATRIHNSTSLPSLMLFVSIFLVKDFRWALGFWIASIFISLVAGGAVSSFFEALGFDDRMSSYLKGAEDEEKMNKFFSRTGFRWDFLLYSAVPIAIGYYTIIKKGITSRKYELILNTYILSNAFWVMVIRAAFSNRFAYLSWFLYPFVLAYPFLRLNVWDDQAKKLALMLMANVTFTLIM